MADQKISQRTALSPLGGTEIVPILLVIGEFKCTTQQIANPALPKTADDFINDAAAATGGIGIGKLYHTAGTVKIRLT